MLQTLKKLYRDESGDALQYLVVAGVMIFFFLAIWKFTGVDTTVEGKFKGIKEYMSGTTVPNN